MNPYSKILTWNVLHRVHAENHSEPAILRFPDETVRVRAVAARVLNALTGEGYEFALLQEVSGDVLAELRARLPGWSVLDHQYPRVPRQKGSSLRDPREHLVVVAPQGAALSRAHTFASDPGKGFLMVQVNERLSVITTHVSWGTKAVAQLAVLAQILREAQTAVCLGGDFNAEREAISGALGADVTAGLLPSGSLKTRPKGDGGGDIDHLFCKGAVLEDLHVLEHEELSDHRPVAAKVVLAR